MIQTWEGFHGDAANLKFSGSGIGGFHVTRSTGGHKELREPLSWQSARKWGPQFQNHKEPNLANKLNEWAWKQIHAQSLQKECMNYRKLTLWYSKQRTSLSHTGPSILTYRSEIINLCVCVLITEIALICYDSNRKRKHQFFSLRSDMHWLIKGHIPFQED